jgi:hypothetical protein
MHLNNSPYTPNRDFAELHGKIIKIYAEFTMRSQAMQSSFTIKKLEYHEQRFKKNVRFAGYTVFLTSAYQPISRVMAMAHLL